MTSFAAITAENSQRVIMNDNLGRVPPEEWICADGHDAAWYCICCYGKKYDIDPRDVGYARLPLKQKETQ